MSNENPESSIHEKAEPEESLEIAEDAARSLSEALR